MPGGSEVLGTYIFPLILTRTLMAKETPMLSRILNIRIVILDGTSSTLGTLKKTERQGLTYNLVISLKMSLITIQLITIYLNDYSFTSGMICQPNQLTMVK